ncbi:class I SAM-dependent methyltransferase [Marinospirillum alkaliphilum]|uniref:16S rRNA (Guanine1207-N2)-methyltransferase n=1 Tax=Marinospirillum alkaliphilum DSM 21637 TaxID=1122209 RepID=A0A1K1ZGV7_9GAMM|nr:class I SAM-dependent methyltransferase [Marinospirillum alkaliphilum]SFX73344.1 16S rRNA (guanine1207-N2)-methyltransferase [Marinospirillum alkaliphilum DSM 21637]
MSSTSFDSPLNQFLFRQLAQWQDQPLNLIAAPAALDWLGLARFFSQHRQPLQSWTADWRAHQLALQAGITSHFVSDTTPTQLPGRTLVCWPKSREEGEWWLQQLPTLQPATLLLAGETQGGIKALAKQLQDRECRIAKLDSARRCALWQLQPDDLNLLDLKTASGTNPLHYWPGPADLQLASQPGVFSHGRVDEGSALLLETLKEHHSQLQGNQLLDVGCGCGLLGAWLLKHQPHWQLTAVDVSGFALAATRATLQANQLSGQVLPADVFQGVESHTPAGGFDLLLSNPPFHTGKATDYGPARRLILEAPAHLRKGGQLWLVANRFLPYPDLLQQAFGSFNILAETGKFRVYQAIR